MEGIPEYCQSKTDWQNAVDYAVKTGSNKAELYQRLKHLRDDHFINVLKEESAGKDSEELTPDDFEPKEDCNAEKYKLGFTDAEIESLMEKLI